MRQTNSLRPDGIEIQITRETLPEQVARHLLRYITDDKLQPGDMLPSVASLAADFGVSRTVIREALKSIAALGVIEIVKGKGALVSTVDSDLLRIFFQRTLQTEPNSLTALMEVRKPLEMQAAALAALHRTEEDLKQMEELVAALRENQYNPDRYTTLDTEYHEAISHASQNPILYALVSALRNVVKDLMIAMRAKREIQGRLGEEQKFHEAVLDGIRRRDVEAARTAMESHLNESLMLLVDTVPGSIGTPDSLS